MDELYVALSALAGGLVAALLGWLESKEEFDPRKFGGSVARALIAAAVFAAGYSLAGKVSTFDLLYAFLGGAGVDVIGNRLAGRLGNGSFPLAANGKNGNKAVDAEPPATEKASEGDESGPEATGKVSNDTGDTAVAGGETGSKES